MRCTFVVPMETTVRNTWFKTFLFDKKYWILRHLLFWTIIYIDEVFNVIGLIDYGPVDKMLLIPIVLDFFLVYFNIYYLIPKFLYKDRLLIYTLTTILQIALVIFINYYVYDHFIDPLSPEDLAEIDYVATYIQGTITQLGILFPAVAITLFKSNWNSSNELNALNKLRYESELDYLKKQVNPHFLFNSLNAIYVQAKQKSDTLPESIMALSNLMRYQTYDGMQEKVPLTKEVDFIKNYLEMEKMRRENLEIKINVDDRIKGKAIEPLLLLPLVENACKYSVQILTAHKSFIHLSINLLNNEVIVVIENNLGDVSEEKDDKYSGLGQSNVKKRLDLLYPNDHSFTTEISEDSYKVILKISSQTFNV